MPGALRMACTAALAVALLVMTGAPRALAGHVECGDVVTRDTTLDSDLTDCPGDGIVIGADDITLDLNGQVVDGDGDHWGSGVASDEHVGVTIEGGTVQEFLTGVQIELSNNPGETHVAGTGIPHETNGYLGGNVIRSLELRDNPHAGIELSGSGSDRIEDNRVHSSGVGIKVRGIWPAIASGTSIRRNRLSQNWTGVDAEVHDGRIRDNVASDNGVGFTIWTLAGRVERNLSVGNYVGFDINSHDSDIDSNTATANRLDGIGLSRLSNRSGFTSTRVTRNVAYANGQDGIAHGVWQWGSVFTPSPQGNVFVGNRAYDNERHGFHLFASGGNRYERNRVTHNGASGMYFVFPRYNELSDNTVTDNGETGIFLGGRAPGNEDNVIEGNSVLRNGGAGISTDGYRNRLEHNSAHRNGGDGIVVWNLLQNLVRENSANRNGDDGIEVAEDAPSVVAGNSANRNHDLGIMVTEGVVDGGGNRARRNGNPVQCLNIACQWP